MVKPKPVTVNPKDRLNNLLKILLERQKKNDYPELQARIDRVKKELAE